MTVLWHSTKNGQPVCAKEVLVHWAAGRTTALLKSEDPEPITALRELTRLVRFAQGVEEPELAQAIRRVKAFYRLAMSGDLDDATRTGVRDINRFILDDPPELGGLL